MVTYGCRQPSLVYGYDGKMPGALSGGVGEEERMDHVTLGMGGLQL